jgi:UDP-GlcNAc:undecaprenyl-phosphate GlcNAc-1-phosphate transferase
MTPMALSFIVSLIICLLLAKPWLWLLERLKIYDVPNERSVHSRKVLRMGGVIFISGYFASLLAQYYKNPEFASYLNQPSHWAILVGALVMAIIGAIDDQKNLGARLKLILEIGVGYYLCSNGILIEQFHIFGTPIHFGLLTYPVTIFWIVGIMNAVNLVDGLDGLAGGISLIIFSTLYAMNPSTSGFESYINVSLIAGLLVFLKYNYHPARVFMGDVGSLFLGYHIAVFSLTIASFKTATLGILIPIFLLGLPVIDTLVAILRRAKDRKKLFQADKNHIHHQLIQIGFSHKQTVLTLWAVSLCLAIVAFIGSRLGTHASGALLFGIGILLSLFLYLISDFKRLRQESYQSGKSEALELCFNYLKSLNTKDFKDFKNNIETKEELQKILEDSKES